ncbi:MAG: lipoyl(octanoyl) transferase LipB [Pseudomonadota bacterium]|nr:lipoyl(octanoyl) transferase LipB [Pseudomonadota bacterium]
MSSPKLVHLGLVDAALTIEAMRTFSESRDSAKSPTPDEIWLCEHRPVYTQGLAGKAEHLLDAGGIPVIQTTRGGQVTYHGPGQVVAYPLIDLKHLGIYVKEYVYRIEHCVIKTLESYGVTGHRVPGAPGIYVRLDDPFGHAPLERVPPNERLGVVAPDPFKGLGKIAALGIKVNRHYTYHGVALNVAMDLGPYERINPCGYAGLATVDLATLGVHTDVASVSRQLGARLAEHLAP